MFKAANMHVPAGSLQGHLKQALALLNTLHNILEQPNTSLRKHSLIDSILLFLEKCISLLIQTEEKVVQKVKVT